MRKGRGLIDQDIYKELLQVPGAAEILIEYTTNHRFIKGKTRAEISEDAWPEVKQMVANWKRFKKGEKQKDFKKSTNQQPIFQKTDVLSPKIEEEINKIKNLQPGDKFAYKNVGFGMDSYEPANDIIEIKNGKLITRIFETGMNWNGKTWEFKADTFDWITSIVLIENVPKEHSVQWK